MTLRTLIATLPAGIALSLSVAVGPVGAAPPREPLAMSLGLVPRPAAELTPAAADRARLSPEVFLRVPPDDIVAALIDSTRTANVSATVARLQAFVSRYVVSDSCLASGAWIRDRLLEIGYSDVRLDTFRTWTFQDSVLAVNVLAVKPGRGRPDEYVILGGHYDSATTDNFSDPGAPAPGADDNGSGVAGVLEAARVLRDVPTDRSIVFACWSAEEVGLRGSRAWVADALADSLDVVLYLNMDCIGCDGGQPVEGVLSADSLSLAVAGYMADVSERFLGIPFTTTVRPIGSSDQNSFWEAGFRVVDTSTGAESPWHHTSGDVLETMNPALARALAALNIVAAAAVAGIQGEDANLPPETVLVENCAATHAVVTRRPTFAWEGVDFDGEVSSYEYRVQGDGWVRVTAGQTEVTLDLEPDSYVFEVRALDDSGVADGTPARHAFSARDTLAPTLTVATNFLPEPLVFHGTSGSGGAAVRVFENERLVFTVSADASEYCGAADAVAIAVGDTQDWEGPEASPHEFAVRPAPTDTLVLFRTLDENGAPTVGILRLAPVAAPMDHPLLHVDEWLDCETPEAAHDAFYDSLLVHQDHDEMDPVERIGEGLPPLPTMEELGRYRTVLWTVDRHACFLRPEQARESYHAIEGYVRAGGNLILEGPSSLASLDGRDAFSYRPTFGPGDFVHDCVGVDSLLNAGGMANPACPDYYGWAFLGGAPAVDWLSPLPVDTLGKWSGWYEERGGIPWCEVVATAPGTGPLFLFDSYINPTLEGRPCATMRLPADGSGAVAWFGFPFYYVRTEPAVAAVDSLLERLRNWQAPLELLSLDWIAAHDGVSFSFCLSPPGSGAPVNMERADGPGAPFEKMNEEPITEIPCGCYAWTDTSVAPGASYLYRLVVTERWGGTTRHGPWAVDVPGEAVADWLAPLSPNPAAVVTTVGFSVCEDGCNASLTVYDVAGRVVRRLREGPSQAGVNEMPWDLTNDDGRRVAAGVYFVRAAIGGSSFERKVVVLR